MLGLDAAGKTSACLSFYAFVNRHFEHCIIIAILYKLKLNQSVTTIPTGVYLSTSFWTLTEVI